MLRIFVASMLIFVLGGCNTVEGIGKDIKKGGEVIEKTAR